jgi:hypothetical protein
VTAASRLLEELYSKKKGEAMTNQDAFDSWAIVELMGHVRIAGRVSEEERFGAKMGRIDIPTGDGFTTQYFGGSSVYRLTPTTEEAARLVAKQNQPRPVHAWEFPKRELASQSMSTTSFIDEDETECDEGYL